MASRPLTVVALAVGVVATPIDFFWLFQASWLPAPGSGVMIGVSTALFLLWSALSVGAFARREHKAWWSLTVAPLVALGPASLLLLALGCAFSGSCI